MSELVSLPLQAALFGSLQLFALMLAFRALVFLFIICGAYGFYWKLNQAHSESKRHQPVAFTREGLLYEVRHALISEVLFSILLTLPLSYQMFQSLWPAYLPAMRIYVSPSEQGWSWLFVSFVLLIVFHDAWHYWKHRLMHANSYLRSLHRVHHDSLNPSPFAAFSFHPIEDVLEVIWFFPVFFLVPINWYVLLAWSVFFSVLSVVGHLGVESYSDSALEKRMPAVLWKIYRPITLLFNSSRAHNRHHSHVHYNFGIFFSFWDSAMGTLLPESDADQKPIVANVKEFWDQAKRVSSDVLNR